MVTRMMFRNFSWSRCWRWAFVSTSLLLSLASGGSWGASNPENEQVPTAHILETQIVVQNEGYPRWHEYEFTLPKAGAATLRLSNGAKTDASYLDRILGVTVTLCSAPCAVGDEERIVYSSPWFFFYDILEVPVKLQAGTNTVKVHLYTRPGKRLSLRIDAPADALHLARISDTPVLGDSLSVTAILSGLGRPVRDAQIAFKVSGLGDIVEQSAVTNPAGVAKTSLSEFQQAGTGTLTAKVIGMASALVDTISFPLLEARSITLQQDQSTIVVQANSVKKTAFFINIPDKKAVPNDITFETMVSKSGLEVTIGETKATESSTLIVPVTISGQSPGNFWLTSQATLKATGETAKAKMKVKVLEEPGHINVSAPRFFPLAITLPQDETDEEIVRFSTTITGATLPPKRVELEIFDVPTNSWKKLQDGDLFDTGKDGDQISGDLIYSRNLKVRGAIEGTIRFRAVVKSANKILVSQENTLLVTPFPVNASRLPSDFLKDLNSEQMFAGEQVLVKFLPGISSELIQTIVGEVTERLTGSPGKVIGYFPQINIYQVELPSTLNTSEADRAALVRSAASEFAANDMVPYAEPNFRLRLSHAPVTADGSTSSECSGENGQWGADQIQAFQAWGEWNEWLATHSVSHEKRVAIVDSGVQPSSTVNGDLCWGTTDAAPLNERLPQDCDPINVIGGETTDSSSDDGGHGTGVAGIISAKHGNGGISGIAHGIPMFSFGTDHGTAQIIQGILDAANQATVSIINVSQHSWPTGEAYDSMREAVVFAIGAGKMIVAAAGNQMIEIGTGFEIYPCMWPEVLCVANTNASKVLHSTSNHGLAVDLTGPGVDVCTTSTPGYTGLTGTSFSTPHVAGTAAVAWSIRTELLDAEDVIQHLKNNAENIAALNPGKHVGSGLVNLYQALKKPKRLILVLDKSGSMAWSSHPDDFGCEVATAPPSGCEPSRWEVLNQAVSRMLAVSGPYVESDDRFAVALFDSNVPNSNKLDFIPFNQTTISNFISAQFPGGSTSIGAGLTAFETELTAPDASGYHQTILLFTDGDQNKSPYVVTNGSQVRINPTTNSPTGAGAYEFPDVADICPFALRADDTSGLLGTTYLQNIAGLRCDGLMNSMMSIAPSDPDLDMFFIQVANKALMGDKLELAQVTSGQVLRQEDVSTSATFTTSQNDVAFTLLVTWAEPGNRLEKVVLSKDGVDFPVNSSSNGITISSGNSYKAITIRQPYCRHDGKCVKSEGQWTLHMQPTFEGTKTFTYNLFVNVDNATLASEFRVLQSQPGVGQPLKITATLTEAGKPIQGLPAGSVRAIVSRPKTSLGKVLAKAQIEPMQTPEVDPISAAGLKGSAMLADPNLRFSLLDALEPRIEKELILTESTPGLYKASYHATHVSGMYSVRFNVKGHSPDNGSFTRTFSTARSVEVITDEEATGQTIKVSPITPCGLAGGCYAITLTPLDAAGNLLGPGKRGLITVPKFPGRMLKPISDELDGRYTIRVGYLKPETEKLEKLVLDIQGVKLSIPIVEYDKTAPAAPTNLQTTQ